MFLITISCLGQSRKSSNLGLAGEMIYNKSFAENRLYILLNDSVFVKNHRDAIDSLIILYQNLQVATDQVVMAMTSILKTKTRPWKYKRIDKALFKNSLYSLKNYSNPRLEGIRKGLTVTAILFDSLYNKINNYMKLDNSNAHATAMIDVSNAIDIFGSLYSFYKDSRERSASKASSLSDLIQGFRLNPINELLKKAESKKEDKSKSLSMNSK